MEVIIMYFPRLRDLREDKDLNQTQVAKLLFTSQTVYSRYERGVLTIPVEHLIILADFYNVSTDYILGRTNNKKLYK
ncbi:MAG: helix-turn-helix domain-containing protein [Oscillospiraceae bacterium]